MTALPTERDALACPVCGATVQVMGGHLVPHDARRVSCIGGGLTRAQALALHRVNTDAATLHGIVLTLEGLLAQALPVIVERATHAQAVSDATADRYNKAYAGGRVGPAALRRLAGKGEDLLSEAYRLSNLAAAIGAQVNA